MIFIALSGFEGRVAQFVGCLYSQYALELSSKRFATSKMLHKYVPHSAICITTLLACFSIFFGIFNCHSIHKTN